MSKPRKKALTFDTHTAKAEIGIAGNVSQTTLYLWDFVLILSISK